MTLLGTSSCGNDPFRSHREDGERNLDDEEGEIAEPPEVVVISGAATAAAAAAAPQPGGSGSVEPRQESGRQAGTSAATDPWTSYYAYKAQQGDADPAAAAADEFVFDETTGYYYMYATGYYYDAKSQCYYDPVGKCWMRYDYDTSGACRVMLRVSFPASLPGEGGPTSSPIAGYVMVAAAADGQEDQGKVGAGGALDAAVQPVGC